MRADKLKCDSWLRESGGSRELIGVAPCPVTDMLTHAAQDLQDEEELARQRGRGKERVSLKEKTVCLKADTKRYGLFRKF